jgi:hypothetical protein
MKKKRLAASLLLVILAALYWGCGSNKNLDPEADLLLKGADPPTLKVDANPPLTRLTYFLFDIKLGDPNLSPVGKDKWTVDNYSIHYVLVSDPGQHLLALPSDVTHQALGAVVHPGLTGRVAVTIAQDVYLLSNAQGFTGTSDKATVKAQVTFHCHRNNDGTTKVLTTRFMFDVGDF